MQAGLYAFPRHRSRMGVAMTIRKALYRHVAPLVRAHPFVKSTLAAADLQVDRMTHSAAHYVPSLIKPKARHLTIAVTAACNLRCHGCLYGRTFMPGHELALPVMNGLLDDAAQLGFELVRLYGGEPLLYKALPEVVSRCVALGMSPYVTTNGIILRQKVDALYEAGLRNFTLGFYGTEGEYDAYVQRASSYKRLLNSLDYVRARYGDKISLRMNWLLHRQSCSAQQFYQAFEIARTFDMPMQIDLVHYSLPYFTEGPLRFLQFRAEDRPRIESLVDDFIAVKRRFPRLIDHTPEGLASIPDWLIKGPGMRVPCDKYQMIWVGADGTVQLCYVTFRLGNVNEQRLKDMVFNSHHKACARSAFQLDCPNCHCAYDARIQKDRASVLRYGEQAANRAGGASSLGGGAKAQVS